jgi:hypothetical protein
MLRECRAAHGTKPRNDVEDTGGEAGFLEQPAMKSAVSGASSAGLNTTVLHAASAAADFQAMYIVGAL